MSDILALSLAKSAKAKPEEADKPDTRAMQLSAASRVLKAVHSHDAEGLLNALLDLNEITEMCEDEAE